MSYTPVDRDQCSHAQWNPPAVTRWPRRPAPTLLRVVRWRCGSKRIKRKKRNNLHPPVWNPCPSDRQKYVIIWINRNISLQLRSILQHKLNISPFRKLCQIPSCRTCARCNDDHLFGHSTPVSSRASAPLRAARLGGSEAYVLRVCSGTTGPWPLRVPAHGRERRSRSHARGVDDLPRAPTGTVSRQGEAVRARRGDGASI